MANAKKVIVEKEVKVIQKKEMVNLELTPLEAEILMFLVGNISGSMNQSYRDVTEKIYYALSDAKVRNLYDYVDGRTDLIVNDINLRDYIHPSFPLEKE